MKKSFFGTITIMLLLTIVLPLSVNAATLSVDKSEMNVGDVVTVEVNTKQDVESIQFDLQFDSSKYEYVNGSAESNLDSTDSNLIANNIVRVSAFDMNAEKADTVTMKFKAIAGGTSVPFNIVGTVEIGENGENFDAGEVQIKQINGVNTEVSNNAQYVDGNGKVITRLPQTGSKKPIRIYGEIVQGENIVAYALPYSDDTLSIEDIKAQFGNQITVHDTDNNGILGTGETFTLNNIDYTIIVYGDVNGDGRVTTADALRTRKVEQGNVTVDSFKGEALDVVKVDGKDNGEHTANALAQQAFILRKQYGTKEQTILDKYPEEAGNLINDISVNEQVANSKYRYEDISVANLTSSNVITQDILTYELKLNGTIVDKDSKTAEITYAEVNSGNFSMSLYAAQAGTYEVTPIIAGVNVEGGVQKGETYTIEVVENNEITNIKVKEGTTEITGNVQVRVGKEKKLDVEFVHEYTNIKTGYTAPDPFTITEVDDSKVNIALGDESYFESQTTFADHVLTIKPQSKTGNTTITLGVDGVTKTINVNVLPEAKIAGITLNETKLSDTVTTMNPINVYMDKNYVSSDKTEKRVESIKVATGEIKESVFTILPIVLRDEDGDTFNTIKVEDISIYETEDDSNPDFQIKYYALNNNNQYEERYNKEDRVDAIGIALETLLEEGWLEWVNTGLTIEYETVNGTKSATIPVSVFKNGVELTEEPSEDPIKVEETTNNSQGSANDNGNVPTVDDEATEDNSKPSNEDTEASKDNNQEDDFVEGKDEENDGDNTPGKDEEDIPNENPGEPTRPQPTPEGTIAPDEVYDNNSNDNDNDNDNYNYNEPVVEEQ